MQPKTRHCRSPIATKKTDSSTDNQNPNILKPEVQTKKRSSQSLKHATEATKHRPRTSQPISRQARQLQGLNYLRAPFDELFPTNKSSAAGISRKLGEGLTEEVTISSTSSPRKDRAAIGNTQAAFEAPDSLNEDAFTKLGCRKKALPVVCVVLRTGSVSSAVLSVVQCGEAFG